jgi:hypothetical protein
VVSEVTKMEFDIPALSIPRHPRQNRGIIAYVATAFAISALAAGLHANELLQIQGKARRYYSVLHVENLELYTPRKLSYKEILSGDYDCMVRCIYLVYAPEPYYQSKWKSELMDAGASEASAEAFLAILPKSVSSGDTLELQWSKNSGLSVTFGNQLLGRLKDVTTFEAVFNTFLGPHSPSGMAADLIGSQS